MMLRVKKRTAVVSEATAPRSSERWDLHRDGLSVSGLQLFLACRVHFRLRYVEGWGGPEEAAPLEYGSAHHWFLARFHDKRVSWKRVPDLALYQRTWIRDNAAASATRAQIMEEVLAQSAATWPAYMETYRTDRDKEWIGAELEFREVAPFTLQSGKSVPLRGIFDAVLRDDDGMLTLFEAKARGQVDPIMVGDLLEEDLQVMLYLTVLAAQHPEESEFGVWYDLSRRPQHKSIESLRRDLQTRPSHFFARVRRKIKRTRIEEWARRQLQPMLQDVENWAAGGPHYMNPTALTPYGRHSPLFDAILRGDYTKCARQEKRDAAEKE